MKILRSLPFLLLLAFPAILSAQTPVGRPIQVASAVYSALGADVAMNPRGDFVVAWVRVRPDGTFLGVFGRIYAANGSPRTGEFRLNENRSDLPFAVRVAMMDDGSFVAVFANEEGILARRFTAKGQPLGGNFKVAPPLFNGLEIGSRGDGSFVMVWNARNGDEFPFFTRAFGADGQPLGPEVRMAAAQVIPPRLAVGPDGSFLVIWAQVEAPRPVSQDGFIEGRLFNADGTPKGESFSIGEELSENDSSFPRYDVAVDSEGDFLVTWSQRTPGAVQSSTFLRRYAPDGSPLGGPALARYRPTGQEIAAGPDGTFVSVWHSEAGSSLRVVARELTTTGVPLGPLKVLSQRPFELVPPPVLAGNGAGSFVAAWFVGRPRRGEGPVLFVQRLRTE